MRKVPTAIVMLALAAPMLGGCNSFIGKALGLNKKDDAALVQRDGKDYAKAQLALGREGLDSGNYAKAIEAFRNARVFPETSGNAYNGLAIAYMQLGRPDLAERFFKQAIIEDPADKRFQANLNRFYQDVPAVAVRNVREDAPALASQDAATPAPAAAAEPVRVVTNLVGEAKVTAQPAASSLVRLSANEVVIQSRAPAPVAGPDGRRRAATASVAIDKPVRRVNPAYPVRFGIGEPMKVLPAASGYPVRVGFASPQAPVPSKPVTTVRRTANQ